MDVYTMGPYRPNIYMQILVMIYFNTHLISKLTRQSELVELRETKTSFEFWALLLMSEAWKLDGI